MLYFPLQHLLERYYLHPENKSSLLPLSLHAQITHTFPCVLFPWNNTNFYVVCLYTLNWNILDFFVSETIYLLLKTFTWCLLCWVSLWSNHSWEHDKPFRLEKIYFPFYEYLTYESCSGHILKQLLKWICCVSVPY